MGLFDLDSIMGKLAENEAIQKVIAQVTDVCNGVVLAMDHFNNRFDAIEAKQDKIYQQILFPSNVSPAADDGLMGLLADGGEEMVMQKIEKLPDDVNSDGSIGNRIKLIQ